MPELPEVETVVRALDTVLVGRLVKGVRLLGRMRRDFDPAEADRLLKGKKITAVKRRAKYIVIECVGAVGLLSHLGMTGSFRVEQAKIPYGTHDRAAVCLDRGEELRYADVRRFGFVSPIVLPGEGLWPEELAGLGPEPLENAFNAKYLFSRAQNRKTPVKIFIMDQAIVVGVGNIYASEALFAARIDPRRAVNDLTAAEWKALAAEIRKTLRKSIKLGGSSIRNYRTVDGSEGAFQLALNVYGKKAEACSACGTEIESIRQGGRSTFFCPRCQGGV